MKANPRTDLGAHAPAQLPDVGEIAESLDVESPGLYHAVGSEIADSVFWMAEHFWTLIEEAQETERKRAQVLDDAYYEGYDAATKELKL